MRRMRSLRALHCDYADQPRGAVRGETVQPLVGRHAVPVWLRLVAPSLVRILRVLVLAALLFNVRTVVLIICQSDAMVPTPAVP